MTEPVSSYASLDPCVHCGFCLPACPTYLATGDENDSPRGRIVLMRSMERGEIAADDPSLRHHLNACLGCRGCEPACPSGVGYGLGLEAARVRLAAANGLDPFTKVALTLLGSRALSTLGFGVGRLLRGGRIPWRWPRSSRFGQMLRMLEATRPPEREPRWHPGTPPNGVPDRGEAVLFSGCVMSTLFQHVNRATVRTLRANGFRVRALPGVSCCGAPHAHAGAADRARSLARRTLDLLREGTGPIVVDSAGCGAMLRDYGHLLGTDDAKRLSSRVRDVCELLASAGPRTGGELALRVAYDAPCHLQHAQRVHEEVLAVLDAIPGLTRRALEGSDQCCGSAGLFNLTQPEMASAVLDAKLDRIAEAAASLDAVVTGNPGCIMQIATGLRGRGLDLPVLHPIQLLDRSYQNAGHYGAPA